jgi:hypothetical protein
MRILFLFAITIASAFSQTTAFTPLPVVQFFYDNGTPVAGGLVWTYVSGTTTPQVTYSDANGAVPNTNPVQLDIAGRAVIRLGTGLRYTMMLEGPAIFGSGHGIPIWSQDQIFDWGQELRADLGNTTDPAKGAALVEYVSSLGATPTTVASVLGRIKNAADYPGSDMGAKINAAITALSSTAGGEVVVPAGSYTGIATTIDLSYPTYLHCATPGNNAGTPACRLKFNGSVPGITCSDLTGRSSIIEGFAIDGNATGAGSNHGISGDCRFLEIRNVYVKTFSGDGIHLTGARWLVSNTLSSGNYGNGIQATGTNGLCLGCSGGGNVNADIVDAATARGNSYINPLSEASNNNNGLVFAGVSAMVQNPICLENAPLTISGTTNYVSSLYLNGCINSNTGGTSNQFGYATSAGSVMTTMAIGPNPQTSGKTFAWRSGILAANTLDLYDTTDSLGILSYNPTNKLLSSDSTGSPGGLATGTNANTDAAGVMTFPNATYEWFNFSGTYASHPICTVTPEFEATRSLSFAITGAVTSGSGTGGTVSGGGTTTIPDVPWIVYTGTTGFEVHFHSLQTGNVGYRCTPRN